MRQINKRKTTIFLYICNHEKPIHTHERVRDSTLMRERFRDRKGR